MFSSRGRRPPCLLLLHAPGTTGAPESPSARDWRMSTGLGQPMIEVVGENEEGIAGLAAVRGTVHDRECGRLERSEAADGGRRLGRETACAEHVLGLNGSTDEVVPRQRRSVSYLGEKVTAEQGAGGLLVENVCIPPVGHVRGVDAADAPTAEINRTVGCHGNRRPIGEVVDRHHAAYGSAV